MKPLLNNATDRNTLNSDNYQFYLDKLLTLKSIKIQNDELKKRLPLIGQSMQDMYHQVWVHSL